MPLNIPTFRPPDNSGGFSLLNEALKLGLDKYRESQARTALEQLLNPEREVDITREVPAPAEPIQPIPATQIAASPELDKLLHPESQAPFDQPKINTPLVDGSSEASQIVPQEPTPKVSTPAIPERGPMVQQTTTEKMVPKLGEPGYRNVPKGLSADTYNAIARTEMQPTLDRVYAARVAAGLPVDDVLQAMGAKAGAIARPQARINDKGEYVWMKPGMAPVSAGANAPNSYKQATVIGPDGKPQVQVFANKYGDVTQPVGTRGQVLDPRDVAREKSRTNTWKTVYSQAAGRNVIVNGNGELFGGTGDVLYDPKEVAKNGPLVAQTADIYRSVNNVRKSAGELLKSSPQFFERPETAKFVALLGDAAATGQFGPIHEMLNSELKRTMSPAETNYLTNLTNMYEASMSSRNFLGVSARTSDAQRAMVVKTLPDATDVTLQQVEYKLQQFEDLIHTLSQGITNVPMPANGITIQQLNEDMLRRRQGLPEEQSILNRINALPASRVAPSASQPAPKLDYKNMSTEELLRAL